MKHTLKEEIRSQAHRIGFDLVRFTTADPFDERATIARQRIDQGLMDGLPWYHEDRVERGSSPGKLLPGTRSLIALGVSYFTSPPLNPTDSILRGRVARYAWGKDYHRVIDKQMLELIRLLPILCGHEVRAKAYVDTGPMQDRAVAERAGLGWFGKNTNILAPGYGSWIFLAEVLTDLELPPDEPLKKTCGSCQLCITQCPTGAIIAPYVIDNSRCISFLTIELSGPIPRELRPLMGDWVFGCDICQDVCPVNRKSTPTKEPSFLPGEHGYSALDLLPLLEVDEEEFRLLFRGTAITRAKRTGIQRNVCVALGNIGNPVAVQPLSSALNKGDYLVRGHAAWALGRIGTPECLSTLERAQERETDPWVREEIATAMKPLEPTNMQQ